MEKQFILDQIEYWTIAADNKYVEYQIAENDSNKVQYYKNQMKLNYIAAEIEIEYWYNQLYNIYLNELQDGIKNLKTH